MHQKGPSLTKLPTQSTGLHLPGVLGQSDMSESKQRYPSQKKQRMPQDNQTFYGQTLINSHHLAKATAPASTQLSLEKEMKAIIKRVRGSDMPEVTALKRVLQIVWKCKTAAFELAQYLQHTNFAIFVAWTAKSKAHASSTNLETCRTIMKILCSVLNVASSDNKGLKVD